MLFKITQATSIALVFAFALSCSSGDSGGNDDEGGDLGPTFSKTYTNVINNENGLPNTGNYDFSYLHLNKPNMKAPSNTFGDGTWEAIVTDNTLSLKLGTPYDEYMNNEYVSNFVEDGINVSDTQAKFFMIEGFMTSDGRHRLEYKRGGSKDKYVMFAYADRDVNVTGVEKDEYQETTWNCNFKKGWNTMIFTEVGTDNSEIEVTVGTPGSDMKWYLR